MKSWSQVYNIVWIAIPYMHASYCCILYHAIIVWVLYMCTFNLFVCSGGSDSGEAGV